MVWESTGQDSQGKAVILQRLTPIEPRLVVDTRKLLPQYDQRRPSVALPDNGFVVVWAVYLQMVIIRIVARRFNADGSFNGSEFVVNQTTASQDFRILGLDDGLHHCEAFCSKSWSWLATTIYSCALQQ